MKRTTVTIPRELELFLEGAVEAGSFSSKNEVVETAVDATFEDEYIRALAVLSLYQDDKLDPQRAFELADVTDQHLRAILIDKLEYEPDNQESAGQDILETIHKEFSNSIDDEN